MTIESRDKQLTKLKEKKSENSFNWIDKAAHIHYDYNHKLI